ncbi:MAG TPA: hypothetical protein VIH52_00435 [Candidatus Nanoarchaeia archaeon]|nr:hypothetical protein [uncultured archaeon]
MKAYPVQQNVEAAVDKSVETALDYLEAWKIRLERETPELKEMMGKITAALEEKFPDTQWGLELDTKSEGWCLGIKGDLTDVYTLVQELVQGSGIYVYLTHLE